MNFLLAGYNIPFLVALGCCIVLALFQIVSGFGDQQTDAEADLDIDADADLDVEADTDLDVEAESDADLDIDADSDTEAGGTGNADGHAGAGALNALGFGRIPLMLVLMALLGSFGSVGLLANSLLTSGGTYPGWAFAAVLVLSAILALPLTGMLSGVFARLAPRTTTAVKFEQLVGRVGSVVSPVVSTTYGRVTVRDPSGSIQTVYAVIESGEPLPERSEVALVRYDENQRRFVVTSLGAIRRRGRVREEREQP